MTRSAENQGPGPSGEDPSAAAERAAPVHPSASAQRSALAERAAPAERSIAGRPPVRLAPILALVLAGSLLLFWNLGRPYLWQDEAACAVLGERTLEHGRPLGYDGRNLITMDNRRPEDDLRSDRFTGDPESAVRYLAERGDFAADTTWIGHPWGQFVLAGVSLRLFGHGTWQARLPFAAAGLLTLVALYLFVARRFGDPWTAGIAAALLLGNVYWLLHARQCRYYATSTLFLLMTVVAYLRWQEGRKLGAALFVACAWMWFQQDFGSFWPVVGVLAVDAFVASRRSPSRPLLVFGALLLAVLPFVFAYRLLDRLQPAAAPFGAKLMALLFELNEYQLPLILLPALAWMWFRGGHLFRPGERRVVALLAAIPVALLLWMASVGPYPFYRYVVASTPLACALVAFALVRLPAALSGSARPAVLARSIAVIAAAAHVLTPALAAPVAWLVPRKFYMVDAIGPVLRSELPEIAAMLHPKPASDPNGAVVELLRPRLLEEDEVLINYEDLPLMFYLPNRVRGGIACFRVEDRSAPPPRFAVVRRTGPDDRSVYQREIARHAWKEVPADIPDLPWGNNPDPVALYWRRRPGPDKVVVLEYAGPK